MAETRKACPVCAGTGAMRLCFGDRLIAARKAKGWTQDDLAEHLGIGRPQVANLEGSRGQPSTTTLISVAKVLGISTDYLLGLTDSQQQEGQ